MKLIKSLLQQRRANAALQRDISLIRQSGLFDVEYYMARYPDVVTSEMEPLEHYCQVGWQERRNPGPNFNVAFYTEKYPDVAKQGINPLLHFIKYGQQEGREPAEETDSAVQSDDTEEFVDSGLQLLQMQLLAADYQAFDVTFSQYEQHSLSQGKIERVLFALQAERLLAAAEFDALASYCLEQQSSIAEAYYYQAKMALFAGKERQALEYCLQYLLVAPNNVDGVYLLADIAIATGQPELAWQHLVLLLEQSRRAKTWYYLARLVSNHTDSLNYLGLFRKWSSIKASARFHPDVAAATALASHSGGFNELAKQLWHDTIIFSLERKGGAKSVRPQLLTYVQLRHIPDWPFAYESLPYPAVAQQSQRLINALQDFAAIANTPEVSAFLSKQSLASALAGHLTKSLMHELEFAVSDPLQVQKMTELLTENLKFRIEHAAQDVILIQHVNGIQFKVLCYQLVDEYWLHRECGVCWQNKAQPLTTKAFGFGSLLLPADPLSYLNEFADAVTGHTEFDFVLQSKNSTIENSQRLALYGYEKLLAALMWQLNDLESVCLRYLKQLEGEQPYQKLVSANYSIPDIDDLLQYRPKVVLYVSGLENVGYQANMWIPVLEKLPVKAAIVIREKSIAAELDPTVMPVYFMQSLRDIELLEQAGVKTILYPANPQKNVQALRLHRLNHFFINHGESDKVVNQSKFLMAYDKLLVAGPLAEKRIREAGLPVRDNQIAHVGRPQVELMLKQVDQPCTSVKTVLYAPTWEGFVEEANYSSVNAMGYQMLEQLLQCPAIKVLFKYHPYTGYNKNGECGQFLEKMLALATRYSNLEIVDIGAGIHEYMNRSDLLVTDISSVLNDYLYTLKPIILMNPKHFTTTELATTFPSTSAAYLYQDKLPELLDQITANDNRFNDRISLCKQSLGEFPAGSLAEFTRIIVESVAS